MADAAVGVCAGLVCGRVLPVCVGGDFCPRMAGWAALRDGDCHSAGVGGGGCRRGDGVCVAVAGVVYVRSVSLPVKSSAECLVLRLIEQYISLVLIWILDIAELSFLYVRS
jgi:hypothetical protein